MIVTDGFTGNVALKTVEGALAGPRRPGVRRRSTSRQFASMADALKLRMLEAAAPLLPDNTGGALLLGVERRVHHLARRRRRPPRSSTRCASRATA